MDCSDAFDMVIANLDGRIEFLERVVERLKSRDDPCEVSKGEIETLKSVKSSVVEYKRICGDKDALKRQYSKCAECDEPDCSRCDKPDTPSLDLPSERYSER